MLPSVYVFGTLPVLGLQVRLRQPSAQENMGLAGDTDVDASIEMAVGTLVACDSVDQALTCLWALACRSPVDGVVLAVGRLLSFQRNSDGPRFCTRSEGSGKFLFRASGRHPNISVPFVSELDLSDRRVDCATATRVSIASYHLAVVASDVLLDSENSQSTAHRSGTAVSFSSPSGGHRTTTLRTRICLTH